jgi:hypothetical protein
VDAEIDALLAKGMRAKEVSEAVAASTGLSRRDVYQRVLKRR